MMKLNKTCTLMEFMIALSLHSVNTSAQKAGAARNKPQFWLTDPDHGVLFKQQDKGIKPVTGVQKQPTITIDRSKTYQQMDGFGFALTGGSAMLINKMSAEKQATLLKELFGVGGGAIGTS